MSLFKKGDIVRPNGKYKSSNYIPLHNLYELKVEKIRIEFITQKDILVCTIIKGDTIQYGKDRTAGDRIEIFADSMEVINKVNKKLNYSIC